MDTQTTHPTPGARGHFNTDLGYAQVGENYEALLRVNELTNDSLYKVARVDAVLDDRGGVFIETSRQGHESGPLTAGAHFVRFGLPHGGSLTVPAEELGKAVSEAPAACRESRVVDGETVTGVRMSALGLMCCTGEDWLPERGPITSLSSVPLLPAGSEQGSDRMVATQPPAHKRSDYDVMVAGVTSEVKRDRTLWESGNLFAEYVRRNYRTGRPEPSGFVVTKADWCVFIVGGARLEVPRAWLLERMRFVWLAEPGRQRPMSGNGRRTGGVLLLPEELMGQPMPLTVELPAGHEYGAVRIVQVSRRHPGPHSLEVSLGGNAFTLVDCGVSLCPAFYRDLRNKLGEGGFSVSWPNDLPDVSGFLAGLEAFGKAKGVMA